MNTEGSLQLNTAERFPVAKDFSDADLRLERSEAVQRFAQKYAETAAVLPGTPGVEMSTFFERSKALASELRELIQSLEAQPSIDPAMAKTPQSVREAQERARQMGLRLGERSRLEGYRQSTIAAYKEVDTDFLSSWPLKSINECAEQVHESLTHLQTESVTLQGVEAIEHQIDTLQIAVDSAMERVRQRMVRESPTSSMRDIALEASWKKYRWDKTFRAWIEAAREALREKKTYLREVESMTRLRPRQIYHVDDVQEAHRLHRAVQELSRPSRQQLETVTQERALLKEKMGLQRAELQKRLGQREIPAELPPQGMVFRLKERVRAWWSRVQGRPFQTVQELFQQVRANQTEWDRQEALLSAVDSARTQSYIGEDPARVIERRSVIRAQTQELVRGLEIVKAQRILEGDVSARKDRMQFLERIRIYQLEYEQTYQPLYRRVSFSEQALMRALKQQLDEGQRWLREYQKNLHRRNLQLVEMLESTQLPLEHRKQIEKNHTFFAEEEWMTTLPVDILRAKCAFDRYWRELIQDPLNKRFLSLYLKILKDLFKRYSSPHEDEIKMHASYNQMSTEERDVARQLFSRQCLIKNAVTGFMDKQRDEFRARQQHRAWN